MLLCCVFPRACAYGRPALASDFIFLCKTGCTFSQECGFPCRILPKFWKTCNGLFANLREPCALLHVLGKFYISLEFNVAKQCFLASLFVPINKL